MRSTVPLLMPLYALISPGAFYGEHRSSSDLHCTGNLP